MRSVRLGSELEALLERAAAARGESVSEFIRRAVAERVNSTLDARLSGFDDVLGVVHGGGGQARRTGAAFADVVEKRSSRG